MKSLVQIGTPEAFILLEKKILFADYKVTTKEDCFTRYLLPVRNKLPAVMFYKRILGSEIKDGALRNTVMQSLFDYKPRRWYEGHSRYSHSPPPQWEETSPEVLREVLEIADMALKLDITPETREGVLKAQKEIQEILRKRMK